MVNAPHACSSCPFPGVDPFECRLLVMKQAIHPLKDGSAKMKNGREGVYIEVDAQFSGRGYQQSIWLQVRVICGFRFAPVDLAFPWTVERARTRTCAWRVEDHRCVINVASRGRRFGASEVVPKMCYIFCIIYVCESAPPS